MARKWMVMALVGLGLLLPGAARAQLPPYAPGGLHPMPKSLQPAPPTPLNQQPCWEKSLTSAPPVCLTDDGTPNAFLSNGSEHPVGGCYFGIGAVGLIRQNLGNSVVAVQDPSKAGDTGITPTNAPPELLYNDVHRNMFWGVLATIGYQFGPDAVELSGFFLPTTSSTAVRQDQGRLDVPFTNSGQLIGMGGNNNLFLQADRASVTLQTQVANFEANYRHATGYGFEWLVGIRYFNVYETVAIGVADDTTGALASPLTQATYTARSRNQILAPQLGFEYEIPVRPWVAIGGFAKGAWGVDFNAVNVQLQRGDGYIPPNGPNDRRSLTRFGQLYQMGAFVDLLFTERIRLRGGYQALWIANVPTAVNQIDFNLLNASGHRHNNDGSILFHGPLIELNIAF